MTDFPHIYRAEEEDFLRNFQAEAYYYIYGSPKSGKTKLLTLLEEKLSQESQKCVSVSLLGKPLITDEDPLLNWHVALSKKIAELLDITREKAWLNLLDQKNSYREKPKLFFQAFITEVVLEIFSENIVIIVDHIEEISSYKSAHKNLTKDIEHEFFSVIRSLYEKAINVGTSVFDPKRFKRLQFVFSGSTHASDIVEASKGKFNEDFIEIVYVGDFTLEKVKSQTSLQNWLTEIKAASNVIEDISKNTNGHPHLTISAVKSLQGRPSNSAISISKLKNGCKKEYLPLIEQYLRQANNENAFQLYKDLKRKIEIAADSDSKDQKKLVELGVARVIAREDASFLAIHNPILEALITQPTPRRISKDLQIAIWIIVGAGLAFVIAVLTNRPLRIALWALPIFIVIGAADYFGRHPDKSDGFKEWIWNLVDNIRTRFSYFVDTFRRMFKKISRRVSWPLVLAIFSVFILLWFLGVYPLTQAAHLNRQAEETLEEFKESAPYSEQLTFLEEILTVAKQADVLQKFKERTPWKNQEQNVPLLALQYIYENTDESRNFTNEAVRNFGIFDVSSRNDIAAVARLKGDDSINNIVVLRSSESSTLTFKTDHAEIRDIKFTDDGRFLLTSGIGEINIWDLSQKEVKNPVDTLTLEGRSPSKAKRPFLNSMTFLAKGNENALAAISSDGNLVAWKIDVSEGNFTVDKKLFIDENIQSYRGNTLPKGLLRRSSRCLAASGFLNNPDITKHSERLQTWPIDKVMDKRLQEVHQIDPGFAPEALDIDSENRFLAIAGTFQDKTNAYKQAIRLIPLDVNESNLCKPIKTAETVKITLDEESPIADIRFTNNGNNEQQKLLSIHENGAFSVYEIGWGKENKQQDSSPFTVNKLFQKGTDVVKEDSFNPRIAPYPGSDVQFVTSVGEDRMRLWATEITKNLGYLNSLDIPKTFLNGEGKLRVQEMLSIRATNSTQNVFGVLVEDGTVKSLNSRFDEPTPNKYKNVGAIAMRDFGDYYQVAIAGNAQDSENVVDVYRSLNDIDSEDARTARFPEMRAVSSIAFNPKDSTELAFSDGKSIKVAENINSESKDVTQLTLPSKVNNISHLNFNPTGEMLCFLSNGRIYCYDSVSDSPLSLGLSDGEKERSYVDIAFYTNPKRTSKGTFYLLARSAERIDVWKIDSDLSAKQIENFTYKKLENRWGDMLLDKTQSNWDESDSLSWDSWAVDDRGKRLALGGEDEILVFDISQGFESKDFKLENCLIAIYQSKTKGRWGEIQHLAFGQASTGSDSSIVGLSATGQVILAYPGGNFPKLGGWVCTWLDKRSEDSSAEQSQATKDICNQIQLDRSPDTSRP